MLSNTPLIKKFMAGFIILFGIMAYQPYVSALTYDSTCLTNPDVTATASISNDGTNYNTSKATISKGSSIYIKADYTVNYTVVDVTGYTWTCENCNAYMDIYKNYYIEYSQGQNETIKSESGSFSSGKVLTYTAGTTTPDGETIKLTLSIDTTCLSELETTSDTVDLYISDDGGDTGDTDDSGGDTDANNDSDTDTDDDGDTDDSDNDGGTGDTDDDDDTGDNNDSGGDTDANNDGGTGDTDDDDDTGDNDDSGDTDTDDDDDTDDSDDDGGTGDTDDSDDNGGTGDTDDDDTDDADSDTSGSAAEEEMGNGASGGGCALTGNQNHQGAPISMALLALISMAVVGGYRWFFIFRSET